MSDWTLIYEDYSSLSNIKKNLDFPEFQEDNKDSLLSKTKLNPSTVFTTSVVLREWMNFTKVRLYVKGINKVKKHEGYRNIILPNHPNPFDVIAMKYSLYTKAKIAPFTAAAHTLSSIPFLGKFLKNNGIFFIDMKGFKNLEYRENVNNYMKSIVDKGQWLQFFIEGDRHNHERQRKARHGLLKAMCDKPCVFYPVSISYSQIVESYINEIGDVYIEYHDPIFWKPCQDFDKLERLVVSKHQQGVNVYYTDILSTLLLYYGNMNISQIYERIAWMENILTYRGFRVINQHIDKVLSYLKIKLSRDGYVRYSPEQAVKLSHYRERILHTFYDLAKAPTILHLEFAYRSTVDIDNNTEMRNISISSVQHLINLYKNIFAMFSKGNETISIKEFENKLLTPFTNLQMIRNTVRVLTSNKVLKIKDDEYITVV